MMRVDKFVWRLGSGAIEYTLGYAVLGAALMATVGEVGYAAVNHSEWLETNHNWDIGNWHASQDKLADTLGDPFWLHPFDSWRDFGITASAAISSGAIAYGAYKHLYADDAHGHGGHHDEAHGDPHAH